MQKKLVTLPQAIWEGLRKQGFYVPKGDFSSKFFARNILHFSYVKDITFDARKLLFIYLMKEMFPTFDSVVCKGWSECMYNEEDRQLLLNLCDKLDEIVETGEFKHAPIATEAFAEQADS